MSNINFEISEIAYKRMAMFCLRHDIPKTFFYRALMENAAVRRDAKDLALKRWLREKGKIK